MIIPISLMRHREVEQLAQGCSARERSTQNEMQAVWGSNLGTTTPPCLLLREKDPRETPKSLGERGQLLCLVGPPQALGSRLVVGAGVVPCDPGSAKDTRLNVGSHDVTGDIKIDADELALPRGSQRSRPAPQP